MIRHWLPVLVTGSLAAIVFLSWAVAMARAGSREMPPMPVDHEHLHADAERLVSDLPDPWDSRWSQ